MYRAAKPPEEKMGVLPGRANLLLQRTGDPSAAGAPK